VTNRLFVPKGPIYRDKEDKHRAEARNGVIQVEFVIYTVRNWTADSRITPELICKLQEFAINQIYNCAGHFRDGPVTIQDVEHKPPSFEQVPELVNEMCAYVTEQWVESPVHLASYLMWRMNWIHPFFCGNGRTARAISYLALCARPGFVLPGAKTIPELIVENRGPYYDALRAADRSWLIVALDLSAMEELMATLLGEQLVAIHEAATGRPLPH
jgi:Fic family protein